MTAQALLVALAIAFLTTGLRPIIDGQKRWLVWSSIALAPVLLLLAFVWELLPTPGAGSLRAGFENIAADARWWIWLALAVWVAQVVMNALSEIRRNNEIVALRNDTQAIAGVIARGLLPRHITGPQQAMIASFLSRFPPPQHDVVLKGRTDDTEGQSYRSALQEALAKGGWKVKVTNGDDVPEGVRVDFRQTVAHQQLPEDQKNPKADMLLRMAFGQAGVRLDGSGGGGAANLEEDLLTISIGRRRMDTNAVDPPLWWPGR